jgi:hypothetical protein|tara:strand:+ start:1416 stop:1757 length:342 start_codon:yes stop_codon:yes gene_type:complete
MAKSKFDKIRSRFDSAIKELEREQAKADSARTDTTRIKAKAKPKEKAKPKAKTKVGSAVLRRGKATSTTGDMTPAAAEKAAFEMRLKRKYLSFPKAQREELMQAERDRKKAKK